MCCREYFPDTLFSLLLLFCMTKSYICVASISAMPTINFMAIVKPILLYQFYLSTKCSIYVCYTIIKQNTSTEGTLSTSHHQFSLWRTRDSYRFRQNVMENALSNSSHSFPSLKHYTTFKSQATSSCDMICCFDKSHWISINFLVQCQITLKTIS